MEPLSTNPVRQKAYETLLSKPSVTIEQVINAGNRLMKKAKLHRHFFFTPTFLERLLGTTYMRPTAEYLAHFALQGQQNTPLSKDDIQKILRLFEIRISERCPVEYITNDALYMGRHFYVNNNVLVPRSLMSTRFTDFLNKTTWENHRVLDLCTGSGCIGITLALMNPLLHVDLADISAPALEVANININRFNLQNRVRTIQSDLFSNIQGKYDLIITNPPYVAPKVIHKGPEELKKEPHMALDGGGKEGLDLIHRIIKEAPQHLNANGKLIAEVGFAAPALLKKYYPRVLKWYTPAPEKGKESIFDFFLYSGDCVFECDAKTLNKLI